MYGGPDRLAANVQDHSCSFRCNNGIDSNKSNDNNNGGNGNARNNYFFF